LLLQSLTSLVREHTDCTLILGVVFVELGVEFLHPVSPEDLTRYFDWFVIHDLISFKCYENPAYHTTGTLPSGNPELLH
jgi:hypothetical protein